MPSNVIADYNILAAQKRLLKISLKKRNMYRIYLKASISIVYLSILPNTIKKDPTHLKFWGIVPYIRHCRGGHKVRALSQLESKWIFLMDTFSPHGLNIEFDLNCFINDFYIF